MGLTLYILIAILWGGFTMYRWESNQLHELETDQKMGATVMGILWILTVPFYVMVWGMRFVSLKIHEEIASRNNNATD